MRSVRVTLSVLVLGAVVAGCGGSAPDGGPRQVAAGFAAAVAARDGARACHDLAPATRSELVQSQRKPCAVAVLGAQLPKAGSVTSSSRFGTMAQVVFDRDTVFVARFRFGWKVMAAGCTSVPGHPYDCQLQGG